MFKCMAVRIWNVIITQHISYSTSWFITFEFGESNEPIRVKQNIKQNLYSKTYGFCFQKFLCFGVQNEKKTFWAQRL